MAMCEGSERQQTTNLPSIAGLAQLTRREVYVEYRCKKSDTPLSGRLKIFEFPRYYSSQSSELSSHSLST